VLYKGYVLFYRIDGKRPGPWLAATVAVPCPKQASELLRRCIRPASREMAECVVLEHHLEPAQKARKQ
jgi:hypothetical protein